MVGVGVTISSGVLSSGDCSVSSGVLGSISGSSNGGAESLSSSSSLGGAMGGSLCKTDVPLSSGSICALPQANKRLEQDISTIKTIILSANFLIQPLYIACWCIVNAQNLVKVRHMCKFLLLINAWMCAKIDI